MGYEEQLTHLAEPADPNDRDDADSIIVMDYEALWLTKQLRDKAAYVFDGPKSDVADAYADYIDEKVRAYDNTTFRLYAHTDTAKGVLRDVVPDESDSYSGIVRELNYQLDNEL